MKDPRAKPEWALSHCSECRRDRTFHRIKGYTFRCMLCGTKKALREVGHGRDGRLE